jgi:hypothetical protein
MHDVPHSGVDGLADDLAQHRDLVGTSNPVVARLLATLQEVLFGSGASAQIMARLARSWAGRTFRSFYERPLLLGAALRFEALATGNTHPLAAALASETPDPDAITTASVREALDPDRLSLWLLLGSRKVQTNDVSRAVTWQWPAFLIGERPLILIDIGCAAGLNLIADRLELGWRDGAGRALPTSKGDVRERIGFDADPIDLSVPEEAAWLRACIWPGDTARLDALAAAIVAHGEATRRPGELVIERVRARFVPSRLAKLEARVPDDMVLLPFQSFVRGYLDEDEIEAYERGMREWIEGLPRGRAVWMQLEFAPERGDPPAEIVAHCAGGEPVVIGRCGYHPGVVRVDPGAVARLQVALAARG